MATRKYYSYQPIMGRRVDGGRRAITIYVTDHTMLGLNSYAQQHDLRVARAASILLEDAVARVLGETPTGAAAQTDPRPAKG